MLGFISGWFCSLERSLNLGFQFRCPIKLYIEPHIPIVQLQGELDLLDLLKTLWDHLGKVCYILKSDAFCCKFEHVIFLWQSNAKYCLPVQLKHSVFSISIFFSSAILSIFLQSLRKIPLFYLNSWCENFAERRSF